ncbi:MAG: hypothetical protein GY937_14520 [bacterium]|nr:hypothetical protein [bacterium]
MAAIALSVGIAAGWLLRGVDTGDPTAASRSVALATRAPQAVPGTRIDAPRPQSISVHGTDRDDHDPDTGRDDGPRQEPQHVPHDAIANASAYEPFIELDETDPYVEEIDAKQRTLNRREDFLAFGDGPVARSRSVQVALSARNPQTECLPLGAAGCRRDLDCCGAGACRTRAGQIAGFLECTKVR